MVIINKTSLTYRRYRKLNEIMVLRNSKLILMLAMVLMLVAGIITIMYINQAIGYIAIVTGLLIAFFMFIFWVSTNTFYRRHHAQYADMTCEFRFYDYYFEQIVPVSEGNESAQLEYSRISKVYETMDAFFIILNPKEAFVIDKQGFKAGDADDLSAVLKGNVRKYYKIR